ncbi:MAG: methyltransferase domain-containing protein [Solirubrobacterales bacterium]
MASQAELARGQYRKRARRYDRIPGSGLRSRIGLRAVEKLQLERGQTVIDIACGTGGNFAAIERAIGSDGRLIAIDVSDDMLAQAAQRVSHEGWPNVTLIAAPVADVEIPGRADAALFAFAHEPARDPRAVANVLGSVRPGGVVAACGPKWVSRWIFPLNLFVWLLVRRYVTKVSGFREPWSLLAPYLPGLEIEKHMAGAFYVAAGRVAGDA